MTIHYQRRSIGDVNHRSEGFESMLDLFTLISFVLIIASFMFIAKPNEGNMNEAIVSVQKAISGAGVPPTLPKNVVLLVLSRDGSRNKLSFIDGSTGEHSNSSVTVDTIDNSLNKLFSKFNRTSKIKIAFIDGTKQEASPIIAFAIMQWMAKNQHGKFIISFVGES